MSAKTLNTGATLQCPHGGTVDITSAGSPAKADGEAIVTMSDTCTVSGCAFQIPATPPIPSPCVLVQWVMPDVRVRVNGMPTLSQSSVGLCFAGTGLPQGPVTVVNTQAKVSSQ